MYALVAMFVFSALCGAWCYREGADLRSGSPEALAFVNTTRAVFAVRRASQYAVQFVAVR